MAARKSCGSTTRPKEMFIGFLKGVAYVRSDAFFWTFGDGIGLDAIIDQLPYAILLLFDITLMKLVVKMFAE